MLTLSSQCCKTSKQGLVSMLVSRCFQNRAIAGHAQFDQPVLQNLQTALVSKFVSRCFRKEAIRRGCYRQIYP